MELRLSIIFLILFPSAVHSQVAIKMQTEGGVYTIPCKLNDLKLKFIFDTGASDICISLTEAMFMLKNGYLKDNDFRGTEYYQIANGEIKEGTKVNLRVLEIGGQVIYNVEASIIHSISAPLLLGQSALKRFGKFSFDYTSNTLVLGTVNETDNLAILKTQNRLYSDNTPVQIGNQVWMKENLDVQHYQNGDVIPQVQNQEEWNNLKSGAWCYYQNDPDNEQAFGKLYNWYALQDPRGLAPKGWHIPSDKEWNELIGYLGGYLAAGDKLKSKFGWKHDSRDNSSNASMFSATPGGKRAHYGFSELFDGAYFWSASESNTTSAGGFNVERGSTPVHYELQQDNKTWGYSVRCIKN